MECRASNQCPTEAFFQVHSYSVDPPRIEYLDVTITQDCICCGACLDHCPSNAIIYDYDSCIYKVDQNLCDPYGCR